MQTMRLTCYRIFEVEYGSDGLTIKNMKAVTGIRFETLAGAGQFLYSVAPAAGVDLLICQVEEDVEIEDL